MTAVCIVCAFVSLICLIFNAIVVSKLGKMLSKGFDMLGQLDNLSSSLSPFSSLFIDGQNKIS